MKIYTRTGDGGQTSLVGGTRVRKDDARVEAYGTVDELSSAIGLLISYCASDGVVQFLRQVQCDLFRVGSVLAAESAEVVQKYGLQMDGARVDAIEAEIDRISAELPELHSFILPGGSRAACVCHLCRTICRRAEREIVRFSQVQVVDDAVLHYVNRLSDYLFVLARKLNADEHVEEEDFRI